MECREIKRGNDIYKINLVDGWNEEKALETATVLLKHVIESKDKIISYSKLSKKVNFEVNPRNIERYLGAISYSCIESGMSPLSAIVVNKESMMPGDGFIKAYYPHIKNKDDILMKQVEVMNEVMAYKHWDILLEAIS